jgi:hypothetical protein
VDVENLLHELWLRCRMVDVAHVDDAKPYLSGWRIIWSSIAVAVSCDAAVMTTTGINEQSRGPWPGGADGGAQAARTGAAGPDRLALARVGERVAKIFRRYRIDGMGQAAIAVECIVSLAAVEK